jgi:hypothetical protein
MHVPTTEAALLTNRRTATHSLPNGCEGSTEASHARIQTPYHCYRPHASGSRAAQPISLLQLSLFLSFRNDGSIIMIDRGWGVVPQETE